MTIRTTEVLLKLAALMASRRLAVRTDLAVSASLEVIGIGFGVAGPYMLKLLVDVLGRKDVHPLTVCGLIAVFVITWLGGSVVATQRMVFTARVIDAMGKSLVTDALYDRLPESATSRDGDSSRTLGLLERLPFSLQVVCEGLIWRTLPMFIQVAACLAVIMGLIPLRYVAIMALMLVSFVLATWYGSRRQQAFSNAANAAAGKVSETLGDMLRNARRVVLNGALDMEIGTICDRLGDKRKSNERMWWSLVILSCLQYGTVGLGLLVLLVFASSDVAAGRITVGDFVLLQAYAARLTLPLSGFGYTLSQAGVSIANLSDVLDLAGNEHKRGGEDVPSAGPAAIELDKVGFTYGPGLPGVCDVSAKIRPGDVTVIVGPNGSGKSTLAQLIAGVLEPSGGAIRLNGYDFERIPRGIRYRHIMYVPQFIGLFHRSLSDNALYPPTLQTEASLQELLTDRSFYESGRQIDFGVMVGEQGERLSGGQIQKLELARLAGVKVPAIILDESTSSLDPNSEARIIGALMNRYAGETSIIIITHRPRLASIADQVLFMKAGRLVARGKHEDLLRSVPAYADLWA